MKKKLSFFCFLLVIQSLLAQNYSFQGTMSREVLENYLDRSITMAAFESLNSTDKAADIQMLQTIGAKFVGRAAWWWANFGGPEQNFTNFFTRAGQLVSSIKSNDNQVICQAAIFEFVNGSVNSITIPAYVFQDFGLPVVSRTFNYSDMLYPAGTAGLSSNELLEVPNITKQEAKLWVYYLATKYISLGFEALHMGRAEKFNILDIGNQYYWDVLTKIRNYASTRNRGLVLLDAHIGTIGGLYYDLVPSSPLPILQRKLLFDFHSSGMFFQELTTTTCSTGSNPVIINTGGNSLYRKSKGGVNPLGWVTSSNPYLIEYDNGGVHTTTGCGFSTSNSSISYYTWGWDDITWFASQNQTNRDNNLKYSFYKIKCIDNGNGHLEMPGNRGINLAPGQIGVYRAITYNEQSIIAGIWNGSFQSPTDWVKHNFTTEQVINAPNPALAKSTSPIITNGNNRIYYIGTDDRVHGYIKYNGGWMTVSPSYASGNVASQIKAAGGLAINPSSQYIYYVGIDGRVYRYQIIDDFTYSYQAMPTNSTMVTQGLIINGAKLIVPDDNRIYFVVKETLNNNKLRPRALINNGSSWSLINFAGSTDVSPANTIITNPSNTVLYYRGSDGFIYRYTIVNSTTYQYAAMPTNTNMNTQGIRAVDDLLCSSDDQIYYTANEPSNGNAKRVHGIQLYNGNWITVSPTYSSTNVSVNLQSQVQVGTLSVCLGSCSDKILAYVGVDNQLHGYKISPVLQYSYYNYKSLVSPNFATSPLSTSSNNTIYYIASNRIYSFNLEQDHCKNPSVQLIESGCCNYNQLQIDPNSMVNRKIETSVRSTFEKITTYPNPANELINIRLNTEVEGIVKVIITNSLGTTLLEKQYNNISKQDELTLDLSRFNAGMYFLIIEDKNKKTTTQKIIKN